MIIQSRITRVTVYNDRAEVTRSTENELTAGDHLLIFDMLPEQTERNSIQIKGNGEASRFRHDSINFRRIGTHGSYQRT